MTMLIGTKLFNYNGGRGHNACRSYRSGSIMNRYVEACCALAIPMKLRLSWTVYSPNTAIDPLNPAGQPNTLPIYVVTGRLLILR